MKTNPHDPVNPVEKMSGMNIGITLREHFAALAMQGWLSGYPHYEPDAKYLSEKAVEFADALIEALNK